MYNLHKIHFHKRSLKILDIAMYSRSSFVFCIAYVFILEVVEEP